MQKIADAAGKWDREYRPNLPNRRIVAGFFEDTPKDAPGGRTQYVMDELKKLRPKLYDKILSENEKTATSSTTSPREQQGKK